MAGIALFTLASLMGGLAQSSGWLLVARAVQGIGAAVAAPSTLALLQISFPEGPERARAIGAYSAVAGTSGLITSGPTVVSNGTGGFNLVLTLDSTLFVSGYSGTLSLKVTPPDNTTPDHTTWTLTPTLSGGNITSVVAPTPATGEATATPLPVITKFTDDGGSVYVAGGNVTYDVNVNCNTGAVGNLYMIDGSLTDPLPTGMVYVSSSPAGGVVAVCELALAASS